MVSLICLISALALGASITKRLSLRFFAFEAPALAVALGLLLWTWLSFVCALLLPYSLSLPLTIVLAAAVSVWLWRTAPPWRWQTLPGGRLACAVWLAFTALTGILVGWLMWTHDLILQNGSLYSANATWADLGLHASLISHFAAGSRLSLDFPVAAGAHLTYPFMVDLLSSWLIRGGWSLHLAIFVPSILLIAAFFQLIMAFGIRLFKSIGGAVVGLTLTLFCGSAVGMFTAAADFKLSGLTLPEFLTHLPQDYTIPSAPNAQLSNLLADTILPQRAFLMGFTTFATILILFTVLRQSSRPRLAIFTGAIIGLLPLVHAHTFVILMALAGSFWIESYLKTQRVTSIWLWVIIASLAVAAPQILWQSLANTTGTGGHLALGWTLQPGEPLFTFWAHNYGLTGILILALTTLLIIRRPLRRYVAWYVPVLVLFVGANIYSLQPFAYDNLKLILYVYLFTYLFAGYGAVWLIHKYRLLALPLVIIALIITAGGGLAVAREFQHHDLFASPDDIQLAAWIDRSTPPTSVFLTTDRPNQPVSTLAGRSIVTGYRGWLYDYHLDYQPRLDAVQAALNGQLTAHNAYNARYIAVASYEPPEWTVDTDALARTDTLVYTNASWTVYQLPDR